MPVVPAAGYPTPTVPGAVAPRTSVPFNYQTERASPEDFGSQIGQAESRLGATFEQGANLAAEQSNKRLQLYNETTASNASAATQDAWNKMLYGDQNDPNAPPGLFSLKGKAGMDATPQVRQQVLDFFQKTQGSLTNDYQRLQYNNETRRLMSIYLNEIGRHYDNQALVFGESTAKAQASLANQGMASHVDDPEAFGTFLKQRVDAAVNLVRQQGGGPEAEKAAEQSARADGVRIAVNEIGTKDPQKAMEILESNKALIPDTEYKTLYQGLRAKADDAAAYGLAFGPGKVSQKAPVSPETITKIASASGVSPVLANTVASIESGHGTNVGNEKSPSNTGVFQMAPAGQPGGAGTETESQVRAGTEGLKKVQNELSTKLGRPVSNAEVYLAWQQGVTGAQKLLTNPDAPAGQVTKPINISNNGGDPNLSAKTFTDMWTQKYNQREQQFVTGSPSSEPPGLRGEINRIDASDASPEVKLKAMTFAREKASMEWADFQRQEALRKKISDGNAAQYTSQIISDKFDYPTLTGQIAKDVAAGNLTHETAAHLTNMAYEHTIRENGNQSKTYGPGFNAAWDRIILPDGDPNKILDPNQILQMGGSSGQLTPSGVRQLLELMNSKKTPEGDAQVELLSQMKKAAHQALTGTDPTGTFKDPKGEEQYLKFLQYALPQIPVLKAAGKSLNEITDLEKGPFASLLKETSEGGLKRPMAEFLKDLTAGAAGATVTKPPPGTTFHYDTGGNRVAPGAPVAGPAPPIAR